MPLYEVTWQMTGTCQIDAQDDLDAKTRVESLSDAELINSTNSPLAQVISTKVVP